MARIGNVSVSSLISGANAARARQTAYNDSAASYAYNNSEQTSADAKAYIDYLNQQKAKANDPSKALSYDKTINAAQRSYAANESQRAQDAVTTGEGDYGTKMNTLQGLLNDAHARGDLNAAQNISSSMINLSKTWQASNEAAQAKGEAASLKAAHAGISQALTANSSTKTNLDLAMKNALSNGGRLTVGSADGTRIPVTMKTDASGKIALDANGQPEFIKDPAGKGMKMTATQYAQAMSGVLQQQMNIHQAAIKQGLDDSGTHQAEVSKLIDSTDWQKFGPNNAALQASYGKDNNVLPYTTNIDKAGKRSVVESTFNTENGMQVNPKTGALESTTTRTPVMGVSGEGSQNPTVDFNQVLERGGDMNHYSIGASALSNTNKDGTPFMSPVDGTQFASGYSYANPMSPDPLNPQSLFAVGKNGIDGKGNNGPFGDVSHFPDKMRPTVNDLKAAHGSDWQPTLGDDYRALTKDKGLFGGLTDNWKENLTHPMNAISPALRFLHAAPSASAQANSPWALQQAARAQQQAIATQQAAKVAQQVAAARATPTNTPLAAGVNYAARYTNTPTAKIPGAPLLTAPVFTPTKSAPLNPAQQAANTVNSINRLTGFGPAAMTSSGGPQHTTNWWN